MHSDSNLFLAEIIGCRNAIVLQTGEVHQILHSGFIYRFFFIFILICASCTILL